jgi:ABC-type transport system involved in multi-copper enzyme maturation permease subunit
MAAFDISKLNPFGPIFEKELRVASRRKRNHLLRVLYLLALFLILMFAYLTMRERGYTSVAVRMERQNQLGQVFFACFGMFCAIAMGLIGPVLTCTAISAERLHRTLHVLLMTPITSWQIVSGKLCSRLLIAFLLLGLSLPVLALVRLLGGVEIEQMFAVMAMCAATAIFCGAIGLFFSTFLNRAYGVLLLSYATLLFLYLFLPFVSVLMLQRTANRPWFMQFLTAVNPYFAIGFMTTMGRFRISSQWMTNVSLHLLAAAILVMLSSIILRRLARKEGGEASGPLAATGPAFPVAIASENSTAPLPMSMPAPSMAAAPDVTRVSRSVDDNPVLWREIRRPLIGRKSMQIACGIIVVVLLLISYMALAANNDLGDFDTQIGYAIIFNGLLWLIISVISATAIAQEKESDTWTLLLATPLSARQIVMGKFMGLVRRLLLPFALVAVHFVIFAVCNLISWTAVLCVLWVMVSFNLVWIALGLYLSLRCKKVTFAVIVNLLVPIVIYAVFPLLGAILGEIEGGPHSERYAELVLYYLPYFYLGSIVECLRPDQFREIWLPNDSYARFPYTVLLNYLVVWSFIYITVATAILWYTTNRFNRIVGRAEQTDPLPPAAPRRSDLVGA